MYANTSNLTAVRDMSSTRLSIPDPRCGWMVNFLRYRTDDLAQAQAHLRSLDDSIRLEVSNARGFRGYKASVHLSVGSLALTMGCIDSADGYELAFQSQDEYLINMPLCGSGTICAGGVSHDLDHRQVALIAPCCRAVKRWRGPGHVLSLHVPKQVLVRALRDNGVSPQLLRLEAATVLARQEMPAFMRLVNLICGELEEGGLPFRESVVASHYERLMISLLIDCLPRNAPRSQWRSMPSDAPHYIQRAEDYIRANAIESPTAKDIAAAAGVSTRTLQYGFQRHRQTTPTLYIKRVRLERARELLQGAGGRPTRVSDVAADIGCYNTSQFSRDYKAMFGETPSQTVAAQRMLAYAGATVNSGLAVRELPSRSRRRSCATVGSAAHDLLNLRSCT